MGLNEKHVLLNKKYGTNIFSIISQNACHFLKKNGMLRNTVYISEDVNQLPEKITIYG